MKIVSKTKALIATAIIGLVMSFASVSSGQPVADAGALSAPLADAGANRASMPDAEPTGASEPVSGPESPVLASDDEPAASEPSEPAPSEAELSVPEQGAGLFSSVKGGHWLAAFGFLAMLFGSAVRWGMSQKWEFWKSKAGGYVTAASAGLTLLGAGIVTSGSLSFELLANALVATLAAMGLYSSAKDVKKA